MLLAEPPPTQGDIHFRLGEFPVRIHPFFWVMTVLLGLGGRETPPLELLIWILVVLVSIVVHERGHALLQRRYGGYPRIVLYGLGGLAVCDDCDRSSKAQIEISLAGPAAGFILFVLVFVLVRVVGHQAGFASSASLSPESLGVSSISYFEMFGMGLYWETFQAQTVNYLVGGLFQVNLLWGIINLLPIYPLDGGRVSRELCLRGDPSRGIIRSLQISTFAAAAMVLIGISRGSLFLALMFGFLAYSSYRNLQAYRASLW